ncbi:MAG: PD40 domain-containing protein [Bacteroidales bacterium]|nr:PD40 domain-containing protein [Bacteroidales bacterium]
MNRLKHVLLAGASAFILSGCISWEPETVSAEMPPVFPDYMGVTVPANIAPLNFMIEGASRVHVSFLSEGRTLLECACRDEAVALPLKKWKSLLNEVKGGKMDVEVSAWSDRHPYGIKYATFPINVSDYGIDPWVAYRLIEPGYVGWRQLGIYQRDLTSFIERAIVTNSKSGTTCLNCHNFPSYSPESMMFHARGKNGGTVLYHKGELRKVDFSSIGPKKNTTYPAWHPDGRFIAFSANTTRQLFFVEGKQPIEVFDTASDMLIYDVVTGEVITDRRFMTEEDLETYPSWSPDGRYLYFVSHKAPSLPVKFSLDMNYDMLRVPFDPDSCTFGEKVDTLYDSSVRGGSVSYPRVSPDGHYLLYTRADYGTFPIWHDEADLGMIDLHTGEDVDVSVWNEENEADSYHSWSSDGRWVMFGSRRLDGRYTRLYIAFLDPSGTPHKPFLLPQKDPRENQWRLKSYNVPEFITGEVDLPSEAADLFLSED